MKTFLAALITGLLIGGAAQAVPIVQPVVLPNSPQVGDAITVEVLINGLTDGAAPSLGVYDIDLSFNPALVELGAVAFGTGLDVLGLGSIQAATPGIGSVNLFELSLDTIDDLNNLQLGSFFLARVTFTALAAGVNTFGLTANVLGDAEGVAIPDVLVFSTSITIRELAPPPGGIPEPATYALALAALGLAARARRRLRPAKSS